MTRHRPYPAVEVVSWALDSMENSTEATWDSLPELVDRLRFLGQLQAQLERLGKTVAAVEAWAAQADWGKGPRDGPVNEIEDDGLHAKRAHSYRYTWEERPLLFELLQIALTNQDTGEVPPDDIVWRAVDRVLRFGAWTPRATPLYEDNIYDKKTIQNVRRSEYTRSTVKVELSEGDDDDPEPGSTDEPGTVDTPTSDREVDDSD